ncbi:MAG: hypothetical protein LBT97_03310 [Planctomycetota bacterium]|jgi:anti-sigma factor ChrR (cupin superfamily)|nr:hypothetical protein [Planctomycetota bacterium]
MSSGIDIKVWELVGGRVSRFAFDMENRVAAVIKRDCRECAQEVHYGVFSAALWGLNQVSNEGVSVLMGRKMK